MADSPITVGGAYVESDDHVPNPTDMVAQFNTSGLGAHGRIEEVAPIFEVDKVKTAMEVQAALDEDNTKVPATRVLLPETLVDNETAKKELLAVADARTKQGVEIGGATPAEREAEEDGDEGIDAAVERERSNAASNSTGTASAGQHDGSVTSEAGDDDTRRVGRFGTSDRNANKADANQADANQGAGRPVAQKRASAPKE